VASGATSLLDDDDDVDEGSEDAKAALLDMYNDVVDVDMMATVDAGFCGGLSPNK